MSRYWLFMWLWSLLFFFFFQAEDGIRDKLVTGVQTCALPISDASSGLLLVGTLVLDPVAALVRARVLRPRLRLDQPLGARDDLELAVLEDLADEHGAVGVVVVLVHLDGAARRRERLAVDGLADRIDVERLGLLDGLLPDVDAEVARLHRVVRHALGAAGQALLLRVLLERVHELLVVRVLDGLEVVPRREVADQRGGIHAAQLVLGHAVRHDRRVLASQTLIGELLVEGHVAVAVDRREHARAAARGEALDLADDRLVVLVAERRVLLLDVRGRHALGDQERAEDLVRRAREHVVRAEQVELLVAAALLRHQVLGAGDELLVRARAGVEDVLAALLAFVLHGVEEQAVVVLEDRQHRFAADRGPAAEDDRDLVLEEELLGLFREQVPVGGGVDDDRLDLAAHHAALGVDLVDRHQHDVAQRDFADRHRAGERVEDADLDWLLALSGDDAWHPDAGGEAGAGYDGTLQELATRYCHDVSFPLCRRSGVAGLRSPTVGRRLRSGSFPRRLRCRAHYGRRCPFGSWPGCKRRTEADPRKFRALRRGRLDDCLFGRHIAGDRLRHEQRPGDVGHGAATVHRGPAEPLERRLLTEVVAPHQRALGPLDHLPLIEPQAKGLCLSEPRHGQIERGRQLGGTKRL